LFDVGNPGAKVFVGIEDGPCFNQLLDRNPSHFGNFSQGSGLGQQTAGLILGYRIAKQIGLGSLGNLEEFRDHGVVMLGQTRFLSDFTDGRGEVGCVFEFSMPFRRAPLPGPCIKDTKKGTEIGREHEKSGTGVVHDLL
jgi:hypothetical protein